MVLAEGEILTWESENSISDGIILQCLSYPQEKNMQREFNRHQKDVRFNNNVSQSIQPRLYMHTPEVLLEPIIF